MWEERVRSRQTVVGQSIHLRESREEQALTIVPPPPLEVAKASEPLAVLEPRALSGDGDRGRLLVQEREIRRGRGRAKATAIVAIGGSRNFYRLLGWKEACV